MKRIFAHCIAVAAVLCFLPALAGARQQGAAAPLPGSDSKTSNIPRVQPSRTLGLAKAIAEAAAKPTPHTPDGHADLSGTWGYEGDFDIDTKKPDGSITLSFETTGGKPPSEDPDNKSVFNFADKFHELRMAAPNQPPYKPELAAKVKDLDFNENREDPGFFCKRPGIPRAGVPLKIFHMPNEVVFLYAPLSGEVYRDIPTDGRAHDPLDLDTYMGNSVGHWEGDTLVVDSINFNDDTWLGDDGYFHSTKLHVVERFTRKGDTLKYEVTVEDPEVFTRPWVMNPVTKMLVTKGVVITEVEPCMEREEPHMVGHEH